VVSEFTRHCLGGLSVAKTPSCLRGQFWLLPVTYLHSSTPKVVVKKPAQNLLIFVNFRSISVKKSKKDAKKR